MSAGTITLTHNSAAVTGAGTAFTTDLKAGDIIASVVGGVTYTLPVKTVDSATGVTLLKNYDGPTQAGAAWAAVPRDTMNAITAQLAAETAQALRGLNYDKQNWQLVFSGNGDITVRLPDGTTFSGPSWNLIVSELNKKVDSSTLGSAASKDTGVLIGNVMEVGYFGLGGPALPVGNEKACGYYRAIAGASGNPLNNSGVILNHQVYGSNAFTRFATSYELPIPRVFVSTKVNANYYPYYEFYTTGNTTKSSDGTLKVASPVINIFHDGTFETSAEAQGAEVKRISEGVYRIQNILGMNSDGAWGGIDGGFDVPKDRNGQRLLWLDYEVDADGSILVKTYHRTYPDAPEFARNIKDGYEEGTPIDIPSDQFISVRVEMPQDSIWNLAQKAAQEEMAEEEMEQEQIAEE